MVAPRRARLLLLPALVAALSEPEEQPSASCEAWATRGECLSNPHYMLASCRRQCTRGLVDASPEKCAAWSAAGECRNNPLFMMGSCNASCVSLASDAHVKSRAQTREAAREAEARARAADALGREARRGNAAEEELDGARGAPDAARAERGLRPGERAGALEVAEAAVRRAEEDFAEAEDAARAVAEALAGQPVHEAAAATHGDAPGLSPAAADTAAPARAADSGAGEAAAAAAARGGERGGLQRQLDDERAARDTERVARRERQRAEAYHRLGPRRWLLFRTLPLSFTLALVLLSARRERLSGQASAKAAFAPPGFGLGAALPPAARCALDGLHTLQATYTLAGGPGVDSISRALVGLYYVNEAVAYVEELEDIPLSAAIQSAGDVLDAAQLALPALVACLILGHRTGLCSALVGLDVLKDVLAVGGRIVMVWAHAHFFYVNELMIKKLAMVGCTLLMLASVPENRRASKSRAMSGMLVSGDARNAAGAISAAKSALLLAARLLVAVLFMYVGVSEVGRILAGRTPYAQGDAHDTLWPKVVELLLVLPFILGYRTRAVCQVLAGTLLLESLLVWRFWRSDLDLLRAPNAAQQLRVLSHMREHFCTNAAVAGGLLLLQEHGGGKYTLDEYMKKHD